MELIAIIQDIEPLRFRNEYSQASPVKGDVLLAYRGQEALVCLKDGAIDFPRFSGEPQPGAAYTYLFEISGVHYYLFENPSGTDTDGCVFQNVRAFRGAEPRHQAFAGITGWQLFSWYRNNRYCGACGRNMNRDGKERMLSCACGHTVFPKISPAVIVAVTDGDRLLMTRYAGRDYKRYALVAGFTEIGETIEQTVRREVLEEVGLHVKNIRYYKSQPWSFSDTLLVGFFAEADGSTDIVLDTTELSEAVWVHRSEIDTVLDGISLTNEMIMRFKENRVSDFGSEPV
jgi:NAD+ diphosphatase